MKMIPSDITELLMKERETLQQYGDFIAMYGKKYAEAERAYRCALSAEILKLRLSNIPVTIINDLARGKKEVADLKMQRDIAESNYDAIKAKSRLITTDIEVLRSVLSQLKAEYNNIQ